MSDLQVPSHIQDGQEARFKGGGPGHGEGGVGRGLMAVEVGGDVEEFGGVVGGLGAEGQDEVVTGEFALDIMRRTACQTRGWNQRFQDETCDKEGQAVMTLDVSEFVQEHHAAAIGGPVGGGLGEEELLGRRECRRSWEWDGRGFAGGFRGSCGCLGTAEGGEELRARDDRGAGLRNVAGGGAGGGRRA